MDPDQLVKEIKNRFDHATQKRLLKEKYHSKMTFAYGGGMWCAGPDLQTTLLTCSGAEAVLLDLYENPVKVDTKELYAQSQQRWQEQMNAWLIELETLSKNR